MDKMITIDEAFGRYQQALGPLAEETVSVAEAQGRVLSRDVTSSIDLPPFPQSAMDGYAVRAGDTAEASSERPARLSLVGEVPASGLAEVPSIQPGEAVRIFTGGYVPEGADAVLRQEDARVEGEKLLVDEPVEAGQDCRRQGEELRTGDALVGAGTRLSFAHVAALANSGLAEVAVRRAPRVSAFTTGDEVIESGRALRPGQVYDANTPLLRGWLRSQGLATVMATGLPDTLGGTETALREALERSDLVITTGGVSVGDYDFVITAAERIGMEPVFWKVQQKPGKPLFFAVKDDQALLGLPGNPGSAFACLMTHVRRVLDLLQGASAPRPRFGMAKLAEPVSLGKREWWARCRVTSSVKGDAWLELLPQQASHMVANLGETEALARIPTGERVLERGHPVPWTELSG